MNTYTVDTITSRLAGRRTVTAYNEYGEPVVLRVNDVINALNNPDNWYSRKRTLLPPEWHCYVGRHCYIDDTAHWVQLPNYALYTYDKGVAYRCTVAVGYPKPRGAVCYR